jgi:hypothetical protein
VDVQRIADGLWRWTAPPGVGCIYYEAPDAVVLIDPLVPAAEEEKFLAYLDRDIGRLALPVSVLLTDTASERSAPFLRERYRAGDRVPDTVEAYAVGERMAYFIGPHRALVVATVEPWPLSIADLPVELVLVTG